MTDENHRDWVREINDKARANHERALAAGMITDPWLTLVELTDTVRGLAAEMTELAAAVARLTKGEGRP